MGQGGFSEKELTELSKAYMALALEAFEGSDTENAKFYVRKQNEPGTSCMISASIRRTSFSRRRKLPPL